MVHHRYLIASQPSQIRSPQAGRTDKHTNLVRTVILVVGFAKLALEAGADLRANTNTVSNLDRRHLVTNFNGLANDFMTDADWERTVAPTAIDGMDIRTANTAAFNLDVNVTVFKLLRFELKRYLANAPK